MIFFIIIFLINLVLIGYVLYNFIKLKKFKYKLFILLLGFNLFIPYKANALTQNGITLFNSGYQSLGSVSQNRQWTSPIFINDVRRLRFYISSPSFTGGSTYTQYLNFTVQVPYSYVTSVNLSTCGTYVNNNYLSGYTSQYYGRSSYNCVNDGTEPCYINFYYQITRLFQTSQTPDLFIECETNSDFRTNNVSFIYSNVNEGDGTIQAIENTSQSDQNNDNANTDRTNATINSKANEIRGAIEDLQDSNESKSNSIIDKLSDILNATTSGFSNIITNISNLGQTIAFSIGEGVKQLIGNQEVCDTTYVDIDSIQYNGKGLTSTGNIVDSANSGVTSAFVLYPDSKISIYSSRYTAGGAYYCFYNNSSLISCSSPQNLLTGTQLTIPENATTVRFTISSSSNRPTYNISNNCQKKGLFGIFNKISDFFSKMFNTNMDSSNSGFQTLSNSFQNDNFGGLNSVISSPMNFINNLNSTCQPISVSLPRTNQSFNIPCLKTYVTNISSSNDWVTLVSIVTVVINGLICYRVCSSLFIFFHDLRDPNNDDLEVLDL